MPALRPDSDIIGIGSLPYERTLHQKIALGSFFDDLDGSY
jgi:hypothetical protein